MVMFMTGLKFLSEGLGLLLRLRSGLRFLQYRNDLLFGKSLRLHGPLP
jgi:hypothetical protein